MDLYRNMLGLCQLDDTEWIRAKPPPASPEGPVPQRTLCYLTDLNTWPACHYQGLVIRDTYPDPSRWCLVTTDVTLLPQLPVPPGSLEHRRASWT